ncbi:leucyl aminopeptidase [Candidatus Gottesmanbacteria bacterium]|nr:leucyl aminopeptidase [Candidatus Gottesmanbacteria bacterium]
MNIHLKALDVGKLETDALCVFVGFENLSFLSNLDSKLSGALFSVAKKESFSGKRDQKLTLSTNGRIGAYKVFLFGLGRSDEFEPIILKLAVAQAVKEVKKIHGTNCVIELPFVFLKKYPVSTLVQSVTEALYLSTYSFDKYKKKKENDKSLQDGTIHVSPPQLSAAEVAVKKGTILAKASCMARDLVNEPSQICTPTYLAKIALEIAKKNPKIIRVKILEKEDAEKFGMGAYLGVAKGSTEPPKFIHLTYTPKRSKGKIALVGKGITFDTGGVSLKSAEHMETMKLDMAGAATVLSVFAYLTQLEIPYTVSGIIAACENMPSGSAIKPGDIVTSANGKTIEVLNTDAEGRLTLADAFSYVIKIVKPEYLIDLATLTGACMVALGQDITGLWSNNKKLQDELMKAAKETGEKVWPMPLEKDYKELIESGVADVKNIQTGRYGGAITAALFLQEFVDSVSWAHLDIAGPSFAEKETPLTPKGGTGFGVRLLLTFLGQF